MGAGAYPRRALRLAGLAGLALPTILACNFWRAYDNSYGGNPLVFVPEAVEELLRPEESSVPPTGEARPTATVPGLPSQGRLSAECKDPGVVASFQTDCAVDWSHIYWVSVDFTAREFEIKEASTCTDIGESLFTRFFRKAETSISSSRGVVLEDGRLFGRVNQIFTVSSYREGEPVTSDQPPSTTSLMVVGYVDAGKPSVDLGMCPEENIAGGADAILVSGWGPDLNPCSGRPGWPIVCNVRRDS